MKEEALTLDDLAGILMLAERADKDGLFPHPLNPTSLRRFRAAYDRCAAIERIDKKNAADKRKRKAIRFQIAPSVERSESHVKTQSE